MGRIEKDQLQKARDSWSNRGQTRPPFAIEPKDGQRSVWDFPRPPVVEKVAQSVQIKHLDKTLVNTKNALAVLETASPPTYYIPRQDVNMDYLVPILDKNSFCEWKGEAYYWTLKDKSNLIIAWSYKDPFQEFASLKDHLAFYPHHLECFVGDARVKAQSGSFYAGWITPDIVGPFKGDRGTGHW